MRFIGCHGKYPDEGLLFIVAFAIFMLVADRLREGEQNNEQIRENADKLRMIAHTMLDKRVAVCPRPSKADEYGYL